MWSRFRTSPALTVVVGAALALGVYAGRVYLGRGAPVRVLSAEGPIAEVTIVAAPKDCFGALEFVDLFARPQLSSLLTRRVLVTDRSADTSLVRRTIADLGVPFQIGVANRAERRLIQDLGNVQTPFIVVRDRRNVVLLVASAPSTVTQYLALAELVESTTLQLRSR